MAKASITTDEAAQAVHTRTTAGSEESQVAVLGIDGSDDVVPADRTEGLSVKVTGSELPTGASTAANQATLIGHVDGLEGQLTTIAGHLDGVEGLLTTIDGDTSALGATGDAEATAGSTGSLSAKLRLVTRQLAAVQAAVERLDDAISGTEMQVDVVAALPAGANNIGQVDPRGNVAHDAADSGNPVKIGGRARTALPTAVAQDDRTDMVTDKFGRTLALAAPLDARRSGTVNYTNNSAADVIAAPGASTAIVVTRILVVNGHASVGTKVSVRDDTTAKVVGYAAPAGGGWTVEDPNGLFVVATNRAVTAICGTTGADVDVTVFGYTIPA